jgi:hypothetical protein
MLKITMPYKVKQYVLSTPKLPNIDEDEIISKFLSTRFYH